MPKPNNKAPFPNSPNQKNEGLFLRSQLPRLKEWDTDPQSTESDTAPKLNGSSSAGFILYLASKGVVWPNTTSMFSVNLWAKADVMVKTYSHKLPSLSVSLACSILVKSKKNIDSKEIF